MSAVSRIPLHIIFLYLSESTLTCTQTGLGLESIKIGYGGPDLVHVDKRHRLSY
jgi:hypothetical protein